MEILIIFAHVLIGIFGIFMGLISYECFTVNARIVGWTSLIFSSVCAAWLAGQYL